MTTLATVTLPLSVSTLVTALTSFDSDQRQRMWIEPGPRGDQISIVSGREIEHNESVSDQIQMALWTGQEDCDG